MNDRARELASRLIRNFNEASLEHEVREPLYESAAARLGTGTVAHKLGASVDVVAPGKRSCPYHFHHAQEEMFVIIEGEGSLRVADQDGRRPVYSSGPRIPSSDHQYITGTAQVPVDQHAGDARGV